MSTWLSNSERGAGLILSDRQASIGIDPKYFHPPYDEIVKDFINGTPKELIASRHLEAFQIAAHAVEHINGAGDLNWYNVVKKSAIDYGVGNRLFKIGDRLQKGRIDNAAAILREQLNLLSQDTVSGRKSMWEITEQETPFIKSGTKFLDYHIGGIPQQGLTVIAGNPGVGKTWLATDIAIRFIKTQKDKTLGFYTFEMLANELKKRITNSKVVSEEEQKRIFITDTPGMSANDIVNDAAQIENLGVVFIDYADYLIRGEISDTTMGKIYIELSEGAKRLGCPIFLVSQLSRSYQGGMPRPYSIRYSSLAEAAGWMIMMLYNPNIDYFAEDRNCPLPIVDGKGYLLFWKVRGGIKGHPEDATGAIQVRFKGSKGWRNEKGSWFSLKGR